MKRSTVYYTKDQISELIGQQQGCHAGVDEAGRGPLAGPVVAAAVILDPEHRIEGLADSKKLSEKKRSHLEKEIRQYAVAWAIGRAEVAEIDRLNILQASMLAMSRALSGLEYKPDYALVDGNKAPESNCPVYPVVKGDQMVDAISAASILAKQERDRELCILHEQYPHYDFARHKGYPTRAHLEALEKYGVSPVHRLSFSPVRRILEKSSTG